MTDQELDKECELLNLYMKYYVDVLVYNTLINENMKLSLRAFFRYELILDSSIALLMKEIPVSFDLWKKTVIV